MTEKRATKSVASSRQRRTCNHPSCTKKIRRDNKTGYCGLHQMADPNLPTCSWMDCTKQLRSDNKSGYCYLHHCIGTRGPRPVCKEADCTTELNLSNRTGYCPAHKSKADHIRYLRRRGPRPTCKGPDCTTELTLGNTTGYCRTHSMANPNLPICKGPGCTKKLECRNKTGYCQQHRQLYFEDHPEARLKREQDLEKAKRLSQTPEARKRLSQSVKDAWNPERLQKRSADSKALWAALRKRMVPANIGSKAITYQRIVPVLITSHICGSALSNAEVFAIAGTTVSAREMTRIRDYCHVPGPKGQPRKNV